MFFIQPLPSSWSIGRIASSRYEYISHLVFNAGTATYSHFDILNFVFDLLVYFLDIIHHPRSNIQVNGVLSKDNLGYAWQCNAFGHYVLVCFKLYPVPHVYFFISLHVHPPL